MLLLVLILLVPACGPRSVYDVDPPKGEKNSTGVLKEPRELPPGELPPGGLKEPRELPPGER